MHQRLTRTAKVASGMLAALVFASGIAVASNPKFSPKDLGAIGVNADGTLIVLFAMTGLGNAFTTEVTASAQATAEYACRNNGGNFPSDPKKEASTGIVSASGKFTSGKNGNITGSLTLMPPLAPSTLACEGSQEAVLVSICYTDVKVSEESAGEASIPGSPFCRTFF